MFLPGNKNNNKKDKSSLSNFKKYVSSRHANNNFCERTSSLASHCRQGFMMIETAIVLPLFLMACLCFLFLIEAFRIQNSLQTAMYKTGTQLSQCMSLLQKNDNESLIDQYPLVAKGISMTVICEMVKNEVHRNDYSLISGGFEGISFWGSGVENDWIDIVLTYRLKIPFMVFCLPKIPITQQMKIRGWTGANGYGEENKEEPMVYITQTGTVYHYVRDCTYLQLSIKQISSSGIGLQRNSGGAKYYACERCVKKALADQQVYITRDGTRYHNNINCSSLKRNVRAIKLSEVESRPCCSKCGGG